MKNNKTPFILRKDVVTGISIDKALDESKNKPEEKEE